MATDHTIQTSITNDLLIAAHQMAAHYHINYPEHEHIRRVVVDFAPEPPDEPIDFIVYVHEACHSMIIQPTQRHLAGIGCPVCGLVAEPISIQ